MVRLILESSFFCFFTTFHSVLQAVSPSLAVADCTISGAPDSIRLALVLAGMSSGV